MSAAEQGSGEKGWLGRLYDAQGEKLRYLIVGVWNTAFGYGLFAVMWLVLGGALTQALGKSAAAIVVQWSAWFLSVPQSTTTMKYLAFRSKGKLRVQIARAYVIYLPAQLLSMGILWTCTALLHLPVLLGQLITIAVTVIFSYFGHKYFTFRVPLDTSEVVDEKLVEGDAETD